MARLVRGASGLEPRQRRTHLDQLPVALGQRLAQPAFHAPRPVLGLLQLVAQGRRLLVLLAERGAGQMRPHVHLAEDARAQGARHMLVRHEGPIGRPHLAPVAHVAPQGFQLGRIARPADPAQRALEAAVEQFLEGAGEGAVGGRQAHEMAVHVVVGRVGGNLDAGLLGDPAQVGDAGAGADDGTVDAVGLLPQRDAPACGLGIAPDLLAGERSASRMRGDRILDRLSQLVIPGAHGAVPLPETG